jgi:hypothetical protein
VRIQAFIFNWPGKKQHAAILEKLFRPHGETTIINSGDSPRVRHPHWQHIGNDAYVRISGMLLLIALTPTFLFTCRPLCGRKKLDWCWLKRCGIGEILALECPPPTSISMPTFTSGPRWQNWTKEFTRFRLQTVVFWAISGEVLRNPPRVDPRTNKLGR